MLKGYFARNCYRMHTNKYMSSLKPRMGLAFLLLLMFIGMPWLREFLKKTRDLSPEERAAQLELEEVCGQSAMLASINPIMFFLGVE